jgi:TonB-linked SusC/RagA family outer membrane protein
MRKLTLLLAAIGFFSLQGVFAQTSVTGTVTDADNGGTLPGVTVQVQGTSIGTVTDMDGKYSLQVPEDATALIFSFVGMETQEVAFTGQTVINVDMKTGAQALEEVVVTALGITKEKKALGYAVSEVGGEELVGSGENNVIQGLAGKAAGVQVIGSGGTPGASSKILIRGPSTFTNEQQPLIVIDGVPVDNSTSSSVAGDFPFNAGLAGVNNSNRGLDINPDDIESVTILKGPAAAALYGSRGGNGVILYTTKRGNYNQKLKVNYHFSADFSQVNKLPDLQTTYAQGFGGGADNGEGTLTPGTYLSFDDGGGTSGSWGPSIGSDSTLSSYDNMDKFFKTGQGFTHNLSLSAGGEKASFRMALSQLDQSGVIPNTTLNRTSIRITGDVKVSEKFKMGATASYIKTGGLKAQNGSNLSGVMLGLTRAPASWDLEGGENGFLNADGTQYQYFFAYDNPLFTAYRNPFRDNIDRILGNVFLDYSPYTWLNIVSRTGIDYYTDKREQVFSIGSWDPASAPNGEVYYNDISRREIYSDLLLTGKHTFSEDFEGSVTLGGNITMRDFYEVYARGRFLTIPNFYNLSNASDLYASNFKAFERNSALFADLNLSYKNMLFLNASFRNEWASTFGPNTNNFFYPQVSLSWVFTEMMDVNWFDLGKVRIGFAQSGIEPPLYSSATYFGSPILTDGFTDGFSFPYGGLSGFGWNSVVGDANLQPEIVTGYEVGLDLSLFTGRLNVDLTLYQQNSTDILIDRPLAPSSGYTVLYSNLGKMENRGIELMISGDPIVTKDFKWNLMVNFSRNVNEVTELAPGVDEVSVEAAFASIGSFAIVGEPYGVFYGTKYRRTESGEYIINPSTGLPIVEDERGNIGNPYPDWIGALRNTFTYKGFTLTALLERRQGGDIWGGTIARLNRLGRTQDVAEARDNNSFFVIEGVLADENGDPTSQQNNIELSAFDYYNRFLGDNSGSAVENAVFDGSWWRLREVSLSYNINLAKYQKVITSAEVYVTGRNLWLSTDYPGVDPETSLTGAGSNIGGFDYFNNPGTKSYIIGVKLNF